MVSENTDPGYWYRHHDTWQMAQDYDYPHPLLCGELAYIAGDYLNMEDHEVLETWKAERDEEPGIWPAREAATTTT